METHITEVNEKLQLILTLGVINSLMQHVQQNGLVEANRSPTPLSSSTVNNADALPSMASISNAEIPCQSTITQDNQEVLQQDGIPVEDNQVEVANMSIEVANTSIESAAELELLTPADVVPIYVKSCSHRKFSVLLIRRLIPK